MIKFFGKIDGFTISESFCGNIQEEKLVRVAAGPSAQSERPAQLSVTDLCETSQNIGSCRRDSSGNISAFDDVNFSLVERLANS